MAQTPPLPRTATETPLVRLELRHGSARPTFHEVAGEEFLIGSVPGCDLRVPGANLPPIIAQVVRRPDGIRFRKLAPTQPILLNGQPVVTQATLAQGDTVQIGAVELHIHLALAQPAQEPVQPEAPRPAVAFVPISSPTPVSPPESNDVWKQYQQEIGQFREQVYKFEEHRKAVEAKQQEMEQRHRLLAEHERELEADRVLWYQRREQIDNECREQTARASGHDSRLRQQEQELQTLRAAFEREQNAAGLREQQLQADSRQAQEQRIQLQQREEKLETDMREFSAKLKTFQPRLDELADREKVISLKEGELARLTESVSKDKMWNDSRWAEKEKHARAQDADMQTREAKLAVEQRAVIQLKTQYEQDVLRFERRLSEIEGREQGSKKRAEEIDSRYEQMQRDVREMEEQARLLDAGQTRLREETERLAKLKSEFEGQAAALAERTATLEGQQAMLATLRTRLERAREELRAQSQQLAADRAKQDEIAGIIKQKLEEAERLKGELDNEDQSREQERALYGQRNDALHEAMTRLKFLQEKLEADDRRIQERSQQLDEQAAEQAEQSGTMPARAQQLLELQLRIEGDRHSMRERDAGLIQAEEARNVLQEQLLRRNEELAARSREIDEREQAVRNREDEIAVARSQVEAEHQKIVDRLNTAREQMEARSVEMQAHAASLSQREDTLRRQIDRLKESGQALGADRKAMFEAKNRTELDHAAAAEKLAQARLELEAFRLETLKQANELGRLMPELELRSEGAIERLAQAREQLRGHLQELHSYSRQSHEDMQDLRTQIQGESDRLRQQELALHRARSEHRLSVTAFRQQLIEWQGRVADMKQFFTEHEGRLELKQQAVEAAKKEVAENSRELEKRAETLKQQQREVAERKTEVERHLGDMRNWYRKKLRDLAGGTPRNYTGAVLEMPGANAVNDPAPNKPASGGRDILSITGDVDPADRKLGELLLQLELVEQDVLIPLWNEARRQRRSLRQVLLTSGTITLYQMALIEAGNVDGLMLGRYRAIDRVQATPREVLYRVFDPVRSSIALLRHLAEQEMSDAIHPDEYRQRFTAAANVSHPNLAATYSVSEINGRPAVLQEWISGIASPEWPAFASAPGVWYRLLGQAALGMQAAHAAGLTHGRLTGQSVVLHADGTLKLVGFGEPAWLTGVSDPEDGVVADMQTLGQLASSWSMLMPAVKRGKPRALPDTLQHVIRRLGAAAFIGFDRNDSAQMVPPFEPEDRYPSISALLEDLDQAGADLPPNSEAWDRLIKHVAENATEGAALRRTA